jgi:GNAT superfamily N-acetyltransferase
MRADDACIWADIERDAESYAGIGADLFYREFGDDPEAWSRRCLLLSDPRGIVVGVLSAWYSRDFLGQDYGRIHWLALRPSYQGKGLARPFLSHAMNLLAAWHERAWLATSIDRIRAVKLYLDYGFVPLIQTQSDRRNWARCRETLQHPGLDAALEVPESR